MIIPYGGQITSKKRNFQLLMSGMFGNTLRIWNSLEEVKRSEYTGTLTLRYKGKYGGMPCEYEVPVNQASHIMDKWAKQGIEKNNIIFNESAPDNFLLIQGEIIHRGQNPYHMFYSTLKKKMRIALCEDGKYSIGLTTKMILRHFMTPSSLEDIYALIDLYPSHAIEFSTYSHNLGHLKGRNTIIWEIRKY